MTKKDGFKDYYESDYYYYYYFVIFSFFILMAFSNYVYMAFPRALIAVCVPFCYCFWRLILSLFFSFFFSNTHSTSAVWQTSLAPLPRHSHRTVSFFNTNPVFYPTTIPSPILSNVLYI